MVSGKNVSLKRGDYAAVQPGDLRSPCPALDALANHGYLPRDGRNIRASEFLDGLNQFGLDFTLRTLLTRPIFLEQSPKDAKAKASWWSIIVNPFAYAFASLGLREPGQKDSEGVPCLNLDQLALHNAVEHDVSLSRLDFAQGDNHSPQPQLIEELLASSTNGKTITVDDFIQLRRRRYDRQKADNPKLDFQGLQIQLACGEVGMLLKVFGNGKEVPVEYLKALFQEGRLPRDEGWSKRTWWPLGLLELSTLANSIKGSGITGSPVDGTVPVADAGH